MQWQERVKPLLDVIIITAHFAKNLTRALKMSHRRALIALRSTLKDVECRVIIEPRNAKLSNSASSVFENQALVQDNLL